MQLFRRINANHSAWLGVAVRATEDHQSNKSSWSPSSGFFGRLGSTNIKRLGCTRPIFLLPLPSVRHPRSREFIGAMRTTPACLSRNESIPRGFADADVVDTRELVSVSSGTSDCGDTQHHSRSGIVVEIGPHSVADDIDMNGRHLKEDIDMNGRHMKVDIVNVKDELASISASPVLRVKSGNRLARNLTEGSHEERRPLVREQPKARRALTEAAGFVPPKRHNSFRDEVGHAAAETFLLTRLAFSLLRYLGVGYRWISKLLALGLYALLLMPGFVQVGYKYFFSKNVIRSIVYGDEPRNRLDLYIPEDGSSQKPVVIFVTGGAWIIGYKAWGALLGLQLSERDVMVCCLDYRNFPQGGISDMVGDISAGIGYVVNNIDQFGGDPDRIYLAGQSAGSHIAACALIEQVRIEIGQKEGILTWKTTQIKAFLGLSGGYNLPKLVDHFHRRGLYKSIFLSVMEGETSLPLYSPELAVQSEAFAPGVALLPPMHLFHGTADYSIPYAASENFASALQRAGATAFLTLYPDKTHTDVFLQDPMRGGHDLLWDDLLGLLHADDEEAKALDANAPHRPRLVPEFLLHWAHIISPF